MAYHLEGRLLEVCNCRVLCPCWIGEDPDFGTCDTIVARHYDTGTFWRAEAPTLILASVPSTEEQLRARLRELAQAAGLQVPELAIEPDPKAKVVPARVAGKGRRSGDSAS